MRTTERATDRPPGPSLTTCTTCGDRVVVGKRGGNGHYVILEASPITLGVGPCSYCKGRGQRRYPEYATVGVVRTALIGDLAGRMTKGSMSSCHVCGGTGVRGEVFDPRVHVVMSDGGIVRSPGSGRVETWDSVYRKHRCTPRTNGEHGHGSCGLSRLAG